MAKEVLCHPLPADSAGDGTQKPESEQPVAAVVCMQSCSRFGSSAIPDAIDRISQANPRSLGGEIGTVLIAAATKHLSFELQEKNVELREFRGKVATLQTQLANRDTQLAIQNERISNLARGRHVRNLFMIFGTTLIAFSIEFFRNSLVPYGYSCVVMGGGIILGTWLSAPSASKEGQQ